MPLTKKLETFLHSKTQTPKELVEESFKGKIKRKKI